MNVAILALCSLLALGQTVPDSDFLGDAARIRALEQELTTTRTALAKTRDEAERLRGQLAGLMADKVAAEGRASRAEAALRTAAQAPARRASARIRIEQGGRVLGEYDIPEGSAVIGYDLATGNVRVSRGP
jgi:hypothetical protein